MRAVVCSLRKIKGSVSLGGGMKLGCDAAAAGVAFGAFEYEVWAETEAQAASSKKRNQHHAEMSRLGKTCVGSGRARSGKCGAAVNAVCELDFRTLVAKLWHQATCSP